MPARNELIPLARAAQMCPVPPHPGSVWRWCRFGVQTGGGEKFYLKYKRVGGRIYTTAKDLEDFLASLANADSKYFMPVMRL